ncbi:histone deacetylase complex subunit SAP130 isoform X2 [Halyomorpha halys]|uniref:histone deacetylase complex subunit SAP130 isoform X2 n=1 Tax=Halyomorpha halys TaxID=286706 RepID=UPI0006D5234A|nr:histone deacetylase complex subunit SAP130 isoform X2 [Halyomorpha halys]
MADNRAGETPEISASNTIKPEQVRSQGGALLRTIPGPARFVMATPGHSAALISSTTIQTQVLPKVSGQVGGTSVSRINTVPIQATTTTGYHVPRGAAAVANISVPRSSVATPIIRGPTTLQTIGVAQHSLSSSATNTGRSVVGVTCLSGQQRPSPIPVGARLVSSHQMRPLSEVQARPVLVHTAATTHKQVTLTQQAQVQMGGTVKSYSNATRHPNAPSLSRITPTRSPGMVSLPTAVLLPSQPMKQPQHKVITQQSHGTTGVQLPSVASSSVPQTIAIGAVNRPVVIGSGTAGAPVRPAAKPAATTPTDTSQQLYIQGGRNTFLLREPARPKETEPSSLNASSVNCSAPTTATGVNTIYTLPGAGYFDSGASRPLVTLAPARTNQGVATTTPQMMLNSSVMVVEQPRIHTLVPSTSSDCSQGTVTTTESSCVPACSAASGVPVLLPKQVTSPRPSILRKRDPDGLVTSSISLPKKSRSPMKGQKNLTPLLATMSSSPPTLPPSPPPKRPESSSGGSTTVSANSSPGESPPAPLPPPKDEEEPIQLRTLPPEVSPRKKPRKQQLTGNQMTEPAFSEDEMEFISDEKIKKEVKDEEIESKIIPKRKTMSLLSNYKNPWKPRNNHFMRYTDVKPKEEKTPSLSEIANQKNAVQRVEGWKIYHLDSQIDDVVSSEDEFIEFYNSLLCVLEINQKKNKNKEIDKDYSRINERVRANFQRTKVAKDQMLDAKSQIMKFFDHKSYVADIINKNISKRGAGNKKRERI